jgi:hypothetical protein
VSDLDPTSLTQTAQDLRAAAQAVTDYGYARFDYVSPINGSVCAAGAIGIATSRFVRYTSDEDGVFHYREPGWIKTNSPSISRFVNATAALAPLLPTECSGDCDVVCDPNICAHVPGEPCVSATEYHASLEAKNMGLDRVFHYNDYICAGGEELTTLLTQAAEKIETDLP